MISDRLSKGSLMNVSRRKCRVFATRTRYRCSGTKSIHSGKLTRVHVTLGTNRPNHTMKNVLAVYGYTEQDSHEFAALMGDNLLGCL